MICGSSWPFLANTLHCPPCSSLLCSPGFLLRLLSAVRRPGLVLQAVPGAPRGLLQSRCPDGSSRFTACPQALWKIPPYSTSSPLACLLTPPPPACPSSALHQDYLSLTSSRQDPTWPKRGAAWGGAPCWLLLPQLLKMLWSCSIRILLRAGPRTHRAGIPGLTLDVLSQKLCLNKGPR